jgi:hypothetical protein
MPELASEYKQAGVNRHCVRRNDITKSICNAGEKLFASEPIPTDQIEPIRFLPFFHFHIHWLVNSSMQDQSHPYIVKDWCGYAERSDK